MVASLLALALLCTVAAAQDVDLSVGARDDSSLHHARTILLKVYSETGGLDWKNSANWFQQNVNDNGNGVCDWHGVQCYTPESTGDERRLGHVQKVDLSGNNLVGTMPLDILDMPYLQVLNLEDNAHLDMAFVDGSAEARVGLAQHVEEVLLSNTQVSSLRGLASQLQHSLRRLHITNLKISGSDFEEFYDCKELQFLYANYNSFQGQISPKIQRLSNLQELYLLDSDFTGQLPDEIGQLSLLRVLSMGGNSFQGTLPTTLNRLSNLQILALQRDPDNPSGQGIGGPLLSFEDCNQLQQLSLQHQNLKSTIPDSFLRSAPPTQRLLVNLDGNPLFGTIPISLADKRLMTFFVTGTDITGNELVTQSGSSCPQISNWMDSKVASIGCDAFLCPPGTFSTKGFATDAETCQACGSNTDKWGQTVCTNAGTASGSSTSQRQVLIEFYNLLGGSSNWKFTNNWLSLETASVTVCDWYGIDCNSAGDVISINLQDNGLYGNVALPEKFFQRLPNLQSLNLSSNHVSFTDIWPQLFDDAQQMRVLNLDDTGMETFLSPLPLDNNKFASTLETLLVSNNKFNSAVPQELYRFTNLRELDISTSGLKGTLSEQIGALSQLTSLKCGMNLLTGQLPASLGASLSNLQLFTCSANQFDGTIPNSFNSLKELEILSLHQSNFIGGGIGGPLPSFPSLSKLTTLELQSNRFTGNLPSAFLENSQRAQQRIYVSLKDNRLQGTIPDAWKSRFSRLFLDVTENKMTELSDCNNDWMDGKVAQFGCDAILCPRNKFNLVGRQTTSQAICAPCENGGSTSYMGSVECLDGNGNPDTDGGPSTIDILQEIFESTGGKTSWTRSDGWSTNENDYCNGNYYGVHCDVGGRIVKLELEDNGLQGTLPSSLWKLPRLRELYIASNPVDIIWAGVGQATNFEVFHAYDTNIRSVDGIENAAPHLLQVNFGGNQLGGRIPAAIFQLTKLNQLDLHENKLAGPIPFDLFARLTDLEHLNLNTNQLTGQLTADIGDLSKSLEVLNLAETSIDGTIPTQINQLTNLRFLSLQRKGGVTGTDDVGLHYNSEDNDREGTGLTGPLPSFDKLSNLRDLYLGHNSLTGSIPFTFLDGSVQLSQQTNIKVDLTNNRLGGQVPGTLTQFDQVTFYLGGNQFTDLADGLCEKSNWMDGLVGQLGCDAILCPVGMYNDDGRKSSAANVCKTCTTGTAGYMGSFECLTADEHQDNSERAILRMMYNRMDGGSWLHQENWMHPDVSICEWYGITCKSATDESVISIKMPNSGINADLPTEVLTLPELKEIDFRHNRVGVRFDGIPSSNKLEYVDVSHTFTEDLSGIQLLSNLKSLHAEKISFSAFPTNIFQLPNLQVLSLSENKFATGAIPAQFQNMNKLSYFACSECGFNGVLPTWLGSMQNLQYLRLSQNAFNGGIPTEIESLPNLKHLDLSDQRSLKGGLSGGLPAFASQADLVEIILHHNFLDGEIPSNFLQNSRNDELIVIDVRSNFLEGTVPASLNRLTEVDFFAANNRIVEVAPEICNTNWNDGNTADYNCDAILCGSGTWNSNGRATKDLECLPCEASSSVLLGSIICGLSFEHTVLVMFYQQLNGPNWHEDTNWLRAEDHCTWYGITCHEDGEFKGLVKEIDLPDNNIEGQMAVPLFRLTAITDINLRQNDITFSFFQIGNAPGLETLALSETKTSSLQYIGGAQNLKSLHVTNAAVFGEIPDELYDLSNLEELYISYNSLSGSLSPKIGQMESLKDLYIFSNELSDKIPTEIGLLVNLEHISLGENALTGSIPRQLLTLPFLEVLSLQKEKAERCDAMFCPVDPGLDGTLPDFAGLPNLRQLYLGYNRLSGTIPALFAQGIRDKQSRVTFDLSHNHFDGVVPAQLATFDNLRIYLAGNQLSQLPAALCNKNDWMDGQVRYSGCDAIMCPVGTFNEFGRQLDNETECMQCTYANSAQSFGSTECGPVGLDTYDDLRILSELYEVTGGDSWTNRNNWRNDQVSFCEWHGITCEPLGPNGAMTVATIDLDDNNLNGVIPSIIFHLPALRKLSLRRNEIDIGFMAIDESPDLEELYLDETNVDDLRGIEQAPSLKKLHLRSNKYLGSTLPTTLYTMTELTELDLTDSHFVGSLSTEIGNLVNLEELQLAGNNFAGSVPTEVGKLAKLRELDLSGNALFGKLPDSIAQLDKMEVLKIDNTGSGRAGLTGQLQSFKSMTALKELNLAQNQITGIIPTDFLSGIQNPGAAEVAVYVQGNHLIGTVPQSLTNLQKLTIELADNLITELGSGVCNQQGWLGGSVGSYGCDGLLCPPGEFSTMGRQTTSDDACKPCPGSENSPYFGASTCPELEKLKERQVLERLYSTTGGSGWKNNDGWLDDAIDICSWYGISCRDGLTVESIVLGSNHLVGQPPKELFELKNLKNLWLYSNPITFSFDGIAQATSLRSLLLDSTKLESLSGIGAATNLVDLDVRFNNLGGKVPNEIEDLLHLETFSCANNGFSGAVPTFSRTIKLKTLRMSNNNLKGTVPPFDKLQGLTTLDLSDNELFGTIPTNLFNKVDVTSTIYLDLSNNDLTGAIPQELARFDDMTIYLRENRIDEIDPSLCDKAAWNGGDVGKFQCDGLLCPSGSYSTNGRASRAGQACEACSSTKYFGSTTCGRSSSSRLRMGMSVVIPAIVAFGAGLIW